MDIIPSFAQLSMIMQKQHLDIAAVQPCVKATTDAIKKVTDNKSHYLEEFLKQKERKKEQVFYKSVQLNTEKQKEIKDIKKNFTGNLLSLMKRRFPEDHTQVAT